eukprot:TRINITY_DN677_c0_g1_i2.p1 TRINITY_DN677_c0_g1~~TRINITY_DN677_c0_g1_i2.p1  ORF type:complete len:149 (+),score=13.54 TRINITY_DN677_c0_g1_i2:674-1120(+)
MAGLLSNEDEGLPGEYRKVDIQVFDSSVARPSPQDILELMTQFYETLSAGPRDLEHFCDFLARVHSQFQLIHPFRDGNGRIGRLILNILSLKRGYPVLVFSPDNKALFSKAVEEGHLKHRVMFERMILEAFYSSLEKYEIAIGGSLLQ